MSKGDEPIQSRQSHDLLPAPLVKGRSIREGSDLQQDQACFGTMIERCKQAILSPADEDWDDRAIALKKDPARLNFSACGAPNPAKAKLVESPRH